MNSLSRIYVVGKEFGESAVLEDRSSESEKDQRG